MNDGPTGPVPYWSEMSQPRSGCADRFPRLDPVGKIPRSVAFSNGRGASLGSGGRHLRIGRLAAMAGSQPAARQTGGRFLDAGPTAAFRGDHALARIGRQRAGFRARGQFSLADSRLSGRTPRLRGDSMRWPSPISTTYPRTGTGVRRPAARACSSAKRASCLATVFPPSSIFIS